MRCIKKAVLVNNPAKNLILVAYLRLVGRPLVICGYDRDRALREWVGANQAR